MASIELEDISLPVPLIVAVSPSRMTISSYFTASSEIG